MDRWKNLERKLMEELNRNLGKGYELWVTDVNKNNGNYFNMAFQF